MRFEHVLLHECAAGNAQPLCFGIAGLHEFFIDFQAETARPVAARR